MNLVSIVMQRYFFFPFFLVIILESLILGRIIKQNLRFCENLIHTHISLKKGKLNWSSVVFKCIFKEVFFFCLFGISSVVTPVSLLCVFDIFAS